MWDNKDRRLKSQPERSSGPISGLLQQEAKLPYGCPKKKSTVIIWRTIVIRLSEDCFLNWNYKWRTWKFGASSGRSKKPYPQYERWRSKTPALFPLHEKTRLICLFHLLEGNVQLYKPKPAPRRKKEQPVAVPKTKIGKKRRALKVPN